MPRMTKIARWSKKSSISIGFPREDVCVFVSAFYAKKELNFEIIQARLIVDIVAAIKNLLIQTNL